MSDFLDKVKQGIDKGVNVVSVRSKEALDAARIKSQIGALTDRRQEALTGLGEMVYGLFRQGSPGLDEIVRPKCEEIAGLDEEIRQREEELKQVHLEANRNLGIPVCPACGADLAEDDRFCRSCGAKVG